MKKLCSTLLFLLIAHHAFAIGLTKPVTANGFDPTLNIGFSGNNTHAGTEAFNGNVSLGVSATLSCVTCSWLLGNNSPAAGFSRILMDDIITTNTHSIVASFQIHELYRPAIGQDWSAKERAGIVTEAEGDTDNVSIGDVVGIDGNGYAAFATVAANGIAGHLIGVRASAQAFQGAGQTIAEQAGLYALSGDSSADATSVTTQAEAIYAMSGNSAQTVTHDDTILIDSPNTGGTTLPLHHGLHIRNQAFGTANRSIQVDGTAPVQIAPARIDTPVPITIADSGNGSPATSTLTTPVGSLYLYTCSDADGCNLTLGETSVVSGQILKIINVGTNTLNIADTSGVSETAGAFAMGQWDSITFTYVTDRWVENSRSNN